MPKMEKETKKINNNFELPGDIYRVIKKGGRDLKPL